jgi:hypothetical protein
MIDKAVHLVKMTINRGTPGGAVVLLQGRNQAKLVVGGHAHSLYGFHILICIFARREEILRGTTALYREKW